MSANFLGREKGYRDIEGSGFQEGGLSVAEHFSPLATYASRVDHLFGTVAELGFKGIDLWTAHCDPNWATPAHRNAAVAASQHHEVEIVSIAGGLGDSLGTLEAFSQLAADLGCSMLGLGAWRGLMPERNPEVSAVLRQHGVRLAFENHPKEPTPAVLLEVIESGRWPEIGVTLDTGWFATTGYPVEKAVDELSDRLWHVHLKNVVEPGTHVPARWNEGCLDLEPIVRRLRANQYEGWMSVEYEPTDRDPSESCRELREKITGWWQSSLIQKP